MALYREANKNGQQERCVQSLQKEGQLESECVFNKTKIPWIPRQSKEELANAFTFYFPFPTSRVISLTIVYIAIFLLSPY